MNKLSVLAAAAVFSISTAYAQDPTIEGGVEMNISAEQDVSAAIGNESTAEQKIGTIESGSIEGNTEMAVEAAEDVSAAIGNKSCSEQQIGTIGASSACAE